MTQPSNFLRDLTVGQAMDMASKVLFGGEKPKPGPTESTWAPAPSKIQTPRRFLLWRTKDHSGVSGTGYVASGVEFPDGHVAVRWFGHDPSTSLWESVATLEAVHGHQGSTEIQWLD